MSAKECLEAFMLGQRLRAGLMGVGGNEKWYNIKDIAGKALVSRLNTDGVEVYTDYAIGEMPLSHIVTVSFGAMYGTATNGNSVNNVYFYPIASVGDFIEIHFIFPKCTCDYANVTSLTYRYAYLCGVDPTDETKTIWTTCGVNYNHAEPIVFTNNVLGDDAIFEVTYDANGNVTGFRLSGTLLYDVRHFFTHSYLDYKVDEAPSGHNYVEFASYDDFRYRVIKRS